MIVVVRRAHRSSPCLAATRRGAIARQFTPAPASAGKISTSTVSAAAAGVIGPDFLVAGSGHGRAAGLGYAALAVGPFLGIGKAASTRSTTPLLPRMYYGVRSGPADKGAAREPGRRQRTRFMAAVASAASISASLRPSSSG